MAISQSFHSIPVMILIGASQVACAWVPRLGASAGRAGVRGSNWLLRRDNCPAASGVTGQSRYRYEFEEL